MAAEELDAVVVGAGPNGLTAAARLAVAGAKVLVIEGADHIGGGTRTAELLRSGVVHDVCSAVHPLGFVSPAFAALGLRERGLEWVQPPIALSHALGGERAAVLDPDTTVTSESIGRDWSRWRRACALSDGSFRAVLDAALQPLWRVPRHPVALGRFGLRAAQSATTFAGRFGEPATGALFGGIAAHGGVRLEQWFTAAPALVLSATAMRGGWPIARGGSQSITEALAAVVTAHGGRIECRRPVRALAELPPARCVLFDVSARQLADIARDRLPEGYVRKLLAFRHGVGACKLDYILSEPIPWLAEPCRRAGTVHVGGSLLEIAASEAVVNDGEIAEDPFVLVGQPTLCDPTRAPGGEHVVWAYCHVPQGRDLTERLDDVVGAVEARIEAFAPGFRDTIVARHVMGPAALEAHDANFHGGDITLGAPDGLQLFVRPTLRYDPYRTPAPDIYLCSAATPPGGGVHGMCGWNAAGSALRHSLADIGRGNGPAWR